jgi:hypothetical protein
MYNLEKIKKIIKKKQEARYRLLKREIRHMRDNIDKALTMFFESTAGRAQTNYSGLEMY